MRSLILAFALSIPLLCPTQGQARLMTSKEFNESVRNSTTDYAVCNYQRYRLGLPKIDAAAQSFIDFCLERLSQVPDRRRAFYWNESLQEATTICGLYVSPPDWLNVSSELVLITDTSDFDKCMKKELWD